MGVSNDPNVNPTTEARLQSGQVYGQRMTGLAEYPEGVVAKHQTDGKKVFLSRTFLEVMALRNRGRD